MRTWTVIATAGWLLASAAAADDGVSLAPKFETGAVQHYVSRSVVRHVVTAELLETKQEVTIHTETGMSLEVSAISSNGEADVLWTTHYMVLTSDGVIGDMAAPLDFDSREPGAGTSPLAPVFMSLIAKPIHIRLDRGGEIVSFDEPQIDAASGVAGQLAKSYFSKEAFAQLPLFITQGAPAKVGVRDAWQRVQRIAFPLGGTDLELHQAFTCQRRKPRQQSARLTMTGSIGTVSAGPAAVNGLDMLQGASMDITASTLKGDYEWDYAYGRLLAAESQLDMSSVLSTRLGRMELTQNMTGSVDLLSAQAFKRKAHAPLRSKRGER